MRLTRSTKTGLLIVALCFAGGAAFLHQLHAQPVFTGVTITKADYWGCDPRAVAGCPVKQQYTEMYFPSGEYVNRSIDVQRAGQPVMVRAYTKAGQFDSYPEIRQHSFFPGVPLREFPSWSADCAASGEKSTGNATILGFDVYTFTATQPDGTITEYRAPSLRCITVGLVRTWNDGGETTYQLPTAIAAGLPDLTNLEIPKDSKDVTPLLLHHDVYVSRRVRAGIAAEAAEAEWQRKTSTIAQLTQASQKWLRLHAQ